MEPIPKSHPAVTAAGIVAILFGAFGVLMAILLEISLRYVSHIHSEGMGAPMPEAVRTMTNFVWLFILALAVLAIFIGVFILRRRNWARVTILIWGGLMAFFCAITIAIMLFLIPHLPSTMPDGSVAPPLMASVKWVAALIYAVPLAVAIWWLVLFTRKAVVEEFNPLAARLHPGKTLDASGFPQGSPAVPSYVPGGLACPLPLIIIAGLDILGGASTLLLLFFPSSFMSTIPVFLFGHVFYGKFVLLAYALIGIVYLVCGIGVIRLKPWALDPLIWFQVVFALSGVVTLLNPHFMPLMKEAMAKMMPANAQIPTNMFMFSDTYLKFMMGFGFLFGAAMLAILIFYRKRFLEAARAKHSLAG